MDRPVTAVIDACVLYSAPVRDLVIRLAQAGLLRRAGRRIFTTNGCAAS